MEVVMLAAHHAVFIDHLRALMHQAIQASGTALDVVTTLHHAPEQVLAVNQVLLWRDSRCSSSLAALVLANQEMAPPSQLAQMNSSTSNNPSSADADANATALLHRRIHKRDRKIKSLTSDVDKLQAQLAQALDRVKFVESEQEQFFEDVQHMKAAYDKLHASHQKLLWEYLPSKDPDMRAIPRLSRQIQESKDAIGPYPITNVLGYGQYATVYDSLSPEEPHEPLAIKAIDKEKLIDLVALHRVNSEIHSLRDPAIQHAGILALREVFHTPRHIYLVTERGGKDLFEFFGPHDHGIAEEMIHKIMLRVALAVETLHRNNYCHRDLKPENILYDPTHASNVDTVKLVDFGLCTKATSAQDAMLHDFCGSPGFFAPEILLQDHYDGQKADIWSLGCILLELILGNERFATMWMAMYDLETLKDHTKFKTLVHASLEAVRTYCNSNAWTYSVKLRSLLLGLLAENPQERLTVHQLVDHAWFCDTAKSPVSPVSPVSPGSSRSQQASSRSPTNSSRPLALPSFTSFSESSIHQEASTLAESPVARRPGSTQSESNNDIHSSPHISVLLAANEPPSSPPRTPTPKLSLPSLSPEKPSCARSPDKTVAKRRSHHATTTPTSPAGTVVNDNPHRRNSRHAVDEQYS